ncbi:hypothetical protein DFH09DRAFT_1273764 [Mycena vulgaris]|nr:hypothetical protein DFH09DRAFT_1273764 [Mycena vulgaris]
MPSSAASRRHLKPAAYGITAAGRRGRRFRMDVGSTTDRLAGVTAIFCRRIRLESPKSASFVNQEAQEHNENPQRKMSRGIDVKKTILRGCLIRLFGFWLVGTGIRPKPTRGFEKEDQEGVEDRAAQQDSKQSNPDGILDNLGQKKEQNVTRKKATLRANASVIMKPESMVIALATSESGEISRITATVNRRDRDREAVLLLRGSTAARGNLHAVAKSPGIARQWKPSEINYASAPIIVKFLRGTGAQEYTSSRGPVDSSSASEPSRRRISGIRKIAKKMLRKRRSSGLGPGRVVLVRHEALRRNQLEFAMSLISLPFELLAEILTQSQAIWLLPARPISHRPTTIAPDVSGKIQEDTARSKTFPLLPPELLLSHVSGRFRDVSINTPQLWTNIQTRIGAQLIPAPIFEKYLQRSQPHPISVTFSTWLQANELEDHTIHLIRHIDRLRELRIRSISRDIMVAALLPFQDVYAPRLEFLTISDDWHDRVNPTTQMAYFHLFMSKYPCLYTLHLHLCGTHLYVPGPRPLMSVTTLEISHTFHVRVTLPDLRDLLTGLPNLTHLSVSNELLDCANIGPPISLPSVRSFSTTIGKGWISTPVLALLDMPCVENVTLNGVSNNQLYYFFQGSRFSFRYPVLRSFSLLSPPSSFGCGSRCIELSEPVLRALASITHFTLQNLFSPDTVLQNILTTTLNGDRALPSLVSVTVYSPRHQTGDIRKILASRSRVVRGDSIKLWLRTPSRASNNPGSNANLIIDDRNTERCINPVLRVRFGPSQRSARFGHLNAGPDERARYILKAM